MRALDGTETDAAEATGGRAETPRPESPRPEAGSGGGRSQRGQGSKLRRLFSRLAADPDELQADELQAEIQASAETMPIGRCQDREQVCLVGTLRTVTFRPHAGVPALEAELWDGTGTVSVVWLGRRQIPGISPGRTIKLRGRITTLRGNRAIYNPIYELRASASD